MRKALTPHARGLHRLPFLVSLSSQITQEIFLDLEREGLMLEQSVSQGKRAPVVAAIYVPGVCNRASPTAACHFFRVVCCLVRNVVPAVGGLIFRLPSVACACLCSVLLRL